MSSIFGQPLVSDSSHREKQIEKAYELQKKLDEFLTPKEERKKEITELFITTQDEGLTFVKKGGGLQKLWSKFIDLRDVRIFDDLCVPGAARQEYRDHRNICTCKSSDQSLKLE